MSAASLFPLALDQWILTQFVVDICMHIYRLALPKRPRSLIDFTVIANTLVPASDPFDVLPALRVLRVLCLQREQKFQVKFSAACY